MMPKVVLARLRPSGGWGRILRVLESFGPRKNVMEPPVVVTFARLRPVNESVSFSESNGRSGIALFVPGCPFGGASILALAMLKAI